MRMRLPLRVTAVLSVVGSVVAGVFACSSDTPAGTPLPNFNGDASLVQDTSVPLPGVDSAAADAVAADSASDGGDAGAHDAGPDSLNACTEVDFAAADYTADSATRLVHFPVDGAVQNYDPHCMRI